MIEHANVIRRALTILTLSSTLFQNRSRTAALVDENGGRAQPAAEQTTRRLAELNLEKLTTIKVDTVCGDPVSADFTQDSIEQDGRQFRSKLNYRF